MGPTNVALVKLFQAEQQLRGALTRMEAVTKGVRLQERKVKDLTEKLQAAQETHKQQQTQAAGLELDLKTRDSRIEKLRLQQQSAKNNKEYQNLLVQINTEKVDRNKVEDQTMKAMEEAEKGQTEVKSLTALLEAEKTKLGTMQEEIGSKAAAVQAEIDQLTPKRDEAAAAVPPQARQAFERLAENYDGEAMAPIAKPDRRREEYLCTACNMSLVADIYNRLSVRNEPVFCPSCQRLLFIPEELSPDKALNTRKSNGKANGKAPDKSEAKPEQEPAGAQ